jgi:hypothetical protein
MADLHPGIDARLRAFIERQHLFFVATAAAGARINLSPKGLDSFRVLGPREVAYLDLTGSGAETAAHLRADGRITLMFCAFEGQPLILRLYGSGRVVRPDSTDWGRLAPLFPPRPDARAIVVAAIERVQTSCGFGIPLYRHERDRPMLDAWAARKGPAGLAAYRRANNATSIDGLPTGLVDAEG